MRRKKSEQGNTYRIRVKETLDQRSTNWFDDLAIIPQENGETLLVGLFADQPALRGLVDQLWNLNFTILSIERMEDQNTQNILLDV